MTSSYVFLMQCVFLVGFFLISHTNGKFEFPKKITADVIDNICAKVPNKGYCSRVLNSDPRIKSADPKAAAGILLQKGCLDASAIKSTIGLLANKETNAELKQRYSITAAFMTTVVAPLNQVRGSLNNLDNVYNHAQASLVKIYSSEDFFLFPVPKEPTNLLTRLTNLDNLLNMIMDDVNFARKIDTPENGFEMFFF